MIFDIVEYIIMEWTMPNKAEYAGYAGGCLSPKKESVAGQFAALKHKSEMYCWTKNLNMEDYGVDK